MEPDAGQDAFAENLSLFASVIGRAAPLLSLCLPFCLVTAVIYVLATTGWWLFLLLFLKKFAFSGRWWILQVKSDFIQIFLGSSMAETHWTFSLAEQAQPETTFVEIIQ